ncbi:MULTISPECIES: O-antigen ligase family protein [unclassified Microbacterium]|uniref:O-antigen ligase family protein n=1 Tax=unclassified Microbacterium TaxID=2609290 RepID=UPI00214A9AF1|nr:MULTISPECIES: O-antigen ligase family protein [unclassified Microbacterium]MCR2785230.1 O-antigen ligase family protein [Microbacterium sp. zg.B96]WIM16762.1 O-antigen ligase family protein [Microbacterium sp. zg-B96]
MAVHTKHPVSAPPAAPVRERTGVLLLRAWCIFVLFTTMAGAAWVLAVGEIPTTVIAIGSGVVSAVLWIVLKPPVQWRRLPWFALAYVAFATASLLWTAWPATTAVTLLLLLITTLQGFFVAAVLTWHELVRAIASACKWVVALSIAFEVWVTVAIGGPILPRFVVPAEKAPDPIVYWSRNNLLDDGRIQGIFGNANLLAYAALLALIVFAIRFAARAPHRPLLVAWMVAALFLFVRAGSATAFLAAGMVVVVLVTILLMRTARRPGERTRYYIGYAVVAVGGLTAAWLLRDRIFGMLGRSADLTGRERIWGTVLEKASERPVAGWGFASPWMPWDPAFDRWIVDHGQTVMQAHNMWIDVFLQLGIIGVVLMAMTYLAFVWRSWFFAVDRPRWDLRADRPYSPLTLLPALTGAILLVQGLAESGPLLLWGWLAVVMFAFKIKQAPLVGVGPAEQTLALERGERPERAA